MLTRPCQGQEPNPKRKAPMKDEFESLLEKFSAATAVKMREHSRAAIELVQELLHRSDVVNDPEKCLYLEDIKRGAMEVLNDLQGVDKTGDGRQCLVSKGTREEYEQMCLDIGNLLDILRPSVGESFSVVA